MDNKEVQQIAKLTMEFIKSNIKVGMSLVEIREMAENKMLSLGASSFWYWNIGAFIFSGKETKLSISGKKYKASNKIVENNDILTIDLSPQVGNVWGDYAETIIIENSLVVQDLNSIKNLEWKDGLIMENKLHNKLLTLATPNTTFQDLYFLMNDYITTSGYVNLDFNKNLGHSIEKHKNDRIYIKKGNKSKLSEVEYFTFEPHIAKKGSEYGFKKESIYYFYNNKLKEL